MYCISLACMLDQISFKIKAALSIFPAVGLNLGLLQLTKFGYKFKHFYYLQNVLLLSSRLTSSSSREHSLLELYFQVVESNTQESFSIAT